jgi:hypothetical protein
MIKKGAYIEQGNFESMLDMIRNEDNSVVADKMNGLVGFLNNKPQTLRWMNMSSVGVHLRRRMAISKWTMRITLLTLLFGIPSHLCEPNRLLFRSPANVALLPFLAFYQQQSIKRTGYVRCNFRAKALTLLPQQTPLSPLTTLP